MLSCHFILACFAHYGILVRESGIDGSDPRMLEFLGEKFKFTYNLTMANGFDPAVAQVSKI